MLSCAITQLQKSVLRAVKWYSSSFFTLFPSPFLECHQLFSISNRDQRLNHLFNVPKSQWSSLWFYKQNKTRKARVTLTSNTFWASILDNNVLSWQNLLLLFLLNLLPPQHLWINFRPSSISIWIIHGNVQAFFPLFSTAPSLLSRNVKKWESDSDHLELNFILFPVLSLSGLIFKGRDLCSLLDFKEQWMECAFLIFLMHGNPWLSAPLLFISILMSDLKYFHNKSRIKRL